MRFSSGASFKKPGRWTANHFPSCTPEQARKFEVLTRQRKRQYEFAAAMDQINQKAGGEKRKIRRSMARALAKNMRRKAVVA